MTTTRTETNIRPLGRQGWQIRNLRIYIIIRFPYFSCPHGLYGRPPRKRSSRQQPAHVSRRPPCSLQSSRATRPQMHPALRPLHLARHRMSPCSGALSCKMKPARSPDTPSTNSIHRDCQSERKILPPAERAHRHLNDPRTSTTRYRRK